VLHTVLPAAEYVPDAQAVHVDDVVAAVVVEYVPAAQLMQSVDAVAPVVVRYVPAGQFVAEDEPVGQYVPAGQMFWVAVVEPAVQ